MRLILGFVALAGLVVAGATLCVLHPSGVGRDLVKGTLVDQATLEPVRGAKVTAISREILQPWDDSSEARTNTRGEFAVPVIPRRWTTYRVRADGYMPVDISPESIDRLDLQLPRATAKPNELVAPLVHFDQASSSFRLDMPSGRFVSGADYDVAVGIDPASDSMVVVEAGPGRSLQVEERGPSVTCWISFPSNLMWAPKAGYVHSARVRRRGESLICFVRRDQGPSYGALELYPKAIFPQKPYAVGWDFDVVWNTTGGRGLCGTERMIFE
jgi:hypothetical protein